MNYAIGYHSPMGWISIQGDDQFIQGISFQEEPFMEPSDAPPHLLECYQQVAAYFEKRLPFGNLKLAPLGTPFQQLVWQTTRNIPFGKTISYLDLAKMVGMPGGSRAVGHANKLNPFLLVNPCHRVVGSDGKLTGYAGGLKRKALLLRHEGARLDFDLFNNLPMDLV
jgi:O-6-methylguanine DNA methyltransferase